MESESQPKSHHDKPQIPQKTTIAVFIGAFLIGLLLLTCSKPITEIFYSASAGQISKLSEKPRFVGIASLFLALAIFLFSYLNGSVQKILWALQGKDETGDGKVKVERIFVHKETVNLEEDDYEENTFTLEELPDLKNKNSTEEKIKEIEQVYGPAINFYRFNEMLADDIEDVRYSLTQEIRKTRWNSNVNLLVGSMTTLTAVTILIYTLFDSVRPGN